MFCEAIVVAWTLNIFCKAATVLANCLSVGVETSAALGRIRTVVNKTQRTGAHFFNAPRPRAYLSPL